jgi:hypothetical protein
MLRFPLRYSAPLCEAGLQSAGMLETVEGSACMRVEAIVKKGGLFIPNPGIPTGNMKQILIDIQPVTPLSPNDPFETAAGLLKTAAPDGVEYQKKIRSEWKKRSCIS